MEKAKKDEIAQEIEKLSQQFVTDSLGSIDYAANAKAIAFLSKEVKSKVADTISDGYTLRNVKPILGFGSSLMEFRLGIEFEKSEINKVVNLSKKSLIITVEIPTKSVRKIDESQNGIDEMRFSTPFSIINPNPASQHRNPISEFQSNREKEMNFFGEMGIPGFNKPGVGDPPDDGSFDFGKLKKGPIVINPGGPFGGKFFGNSDGTTVNATETKTDINTDTGSESESNGIADDSQVDDSDYDGYNSDDVINDGETPDHVTYKRLF